MRTRSMTCTLAILLLASGMVTSTVDAQTSVNWKMTPSELLTNIKKYVSLDAKMLAISEASLKKINAIIDEELSESVLAPLLNQTIAVVNKVANRLVTAVFIDKSIQQSEATLLKNQVLKIYRSLSTAITAKS